MSLITVLHFSIGYPRREQADKEGYALLDPQLIVWGGTLVKVTDVLRNEHKYIMGMLRILKLASDKFESGELVNLEIFTDGLEFAQNYADKKHHGKEEDLLFPAMEEAGLPPNGPVNVMRREHDQGRQYVRAAIEAISKMKTGDREAKQVFLSNLRNFIDMLSRHIQKEDHVLFVMAERIIPSSRLAALEEEFERVDARLGRDYALKYERMITHYGGQTPETESDTAKPGCLALVTDDAELEAAIDTFVEEAN